MPHAHDRRRRFVLTVRDRPGPDDAPTIIRLRRALKYLDRACSFDCVDAYEVPADDPHPPDPPARPA